MVGSIPTAFRRIYSPIAYRICLPLSSHSNVVVPGFTEIKWDTDLGVGGSNDCFCHRGFNSASADTLTHDCLPLSSHRKVIVPGNNENKCDTDLGMEAGGKQRNLANA